MSHALMMIATRRMQRADALCAAQGVTLAVVRAYRDAYKAAALLGNAHPGAMALANAAAARANEARGML